MSGEDEAQSSSATCISSRNFSAPPTRHAAAAAHLPTSTIFTTQLAPSFSSSQPPRWLSQQPQPAPSKASHKRGHEAMSIAASQQQQQQPHRRTMPPGLEMQGSQQHAASSSSSAPSPYVSPYLAAAPSVSAASASSSFSEATASGSYTLSSHAQVLQTIASKTKERASAAQNVELSAGQLAVAQAVEQGKSVFFTGPAGTGKSFLLKYLIGRLNPASTFVTASTGIAAVNIAGTTIHSFAGIGLGTESKEQLVKNMTVAGGARKRWRVVKTLIIDEVSMLDAGLFEKLEHVARFMKGNDSPFGGVQLILTGDFLQLPPVSKGCARFCFEAACWSACIPVIIELDRVFRQSDKSLQSMLAELRRGVCSERTAVAFQACIGRSFDTSDGIEPTRLYSRKAEVNEMNTARLDQLGGEAVQYVAHDHGVAVHVASLQRNCPAPERLTLKLGSQVLLLHNLDVTQGLVNGARGVIIGFQKEDESEKSEWRRVHPQCRWPMVRFTTGHEQIIEPHAWETLEQKKVLANRTQVPLILAWSLTVHKCQGMTLDRVVLDLSSVFEVGQAYVALSRIRSLHSLSLVSFPVNVIRAHQKACAFYEKLRLPTASTSSSSSSSSSISSSFQRSSQTLQLSMGSSIDAAATSGSSSSSSINSQLRRHEQRAGAALNEMIESISTSNSSQQQQQQQQQQREPSPPVAAFSSSNAYSSHIDVSESQDANESSQDQGRSQRNGEPSQSQNMRSESSKSTVRPSSLRKEVLDLCSDDEYEGEPGAESSNDGHSMRSSQHQEESKLMEVEQHMLIASEQEQLQSNNGAAANQHALGIRLLPPLGASQCAHHQQPLHPVQQHQQQHVWLYECALGCRLTVQQHNSTNSTT